MSKETFSYFALSFLKCENVLFTFRTFFFVRTSKTFAAAGVGGGGGVHGGKSSSKGNIVEI